MAYSTTTLDAIAPEFAADARKQTFLGMAVSRLSTTAWGSTAIGGPYDQAVAYLAAHLMTRFPATAATTGAGSASGVITSKKAGDIAETYADPSAVSPGTTADRDYSTTRYGMAYLALRGSRAAGAPRVHRV